MAGHHNNWPYIINLGNSIIGVAILAMPFCFRQCGIILAMLVLLFCTWLTLASCQLLMRAGITSRRRSYGFLAYYTHGATGKFVTEVAMIGMQVGTLIAQIVVIGDLGPAIISKFLGIENSSSLRIFLITVLCLFVGLPLGLLKDLRTVSRASTVCIVFYTLFVIYVCGLSIPNLLTGTWYSKVVFWRPEGLFQCLPILSFSFGCQTQLFLLYDALPEPSLKAISGVISSAVNLCAVSYLLVGFFGYIAFHLSEIPGDVINVFPEALFANLMKLGFVFSIVITFPVIIFPCRASIYTLLFSQKTKHHDDSIEEDFMPENTFKIITISIISGCMVIGILIPNVEFILGMNGAIVGTLVCYIFPALFFLKVMGSKPGGKSIAQLVLIIGVGILVVSTFTTLRSQDKGHTDPVALLDKDGDVARDAHPQDHLMNPIDVENKGPDGAIIKKAKDPDSIDKRNIDDIDQGSPAFSKRKKNGSVADKQTDQEVKEEKISDEIDMEKQKELAAANRAKEKELEEKEKKQKDILNELEKHRQEQEKLLQEQRQVLKELKDHKEQNILDMQEQKQLQQNVAQQQQQNMQEQKQNQVSLQHNAAQQQLQQNALQQKQQQPDQLPQQQQVLEQQLQLQEQEKQQLQLQQKKMQIEQKLQQGEGQQQQLNQVQVQDVNQQKQPEPQQQQQQQPSLLQQEQLKVQQQQLQQQRQQQNIPLQQGQPIVNVKQMGNGQPVQQGNMDLNSNQQAVDHLKDQPVLN